MRVRVSRLGLVHTVPALAAVFHELILDGAREIDAEVEPIHLTDPWLLHATMVAGITPGVLHRLDSHVTHLRAQGVTGVLVTCSSLGEATEEIPAAHGGASVIRIDQAMADRAVELAGDGGRVAVLATVESTIGPTVRLLRRSGAQAGAEVNIETETLTAAGEARAAGDVRRHDALVAQAASRWAVPERADVVVLAQASMAHVADEVAESASIAVVSSPRLAVGRLLARRHV